jgi:voltage-gated potassium channel
MLAAASRLVDLAWTDVVFFSFMTLTAVGYGDITPVSSEARLVALCEAVAGVFFLAFAVHDKVRR